MVTEIKTKKTFGTLDVARISPEPKPDCPRALNIHMTFEDALKLHFGLGQALAKLNSYNRATTDGKRATVNLCVYTDTKRISINEGQLPKGK
ncbi:MAG TPA: hypothetical protein DEP46_07435 [Blastocatellia bacterium]|nr:hypothetical protein [Blastocatellia bacterium]